MSTALTRDLVAASRPVRVFRYRGWNAVCRPCRTSITTAAGRQDHGGQAAAFAAAQEHVNDVHRPNDGRAA